MWELNSKIKDYKYLKDKYPKIMNKEQLRIEARISKATAKRLLDDGLIPCKNSGKQTRNFAILTDDVINYLIDRSENPWRYCKSKDNKFELKVKIFKKLSQLSKHEIESLQLQLISEMSNYNDLLSAEDVAKILGYPKSTIIKWCSKNKLKKIVVGKKFVIPKMFLVEFLTNTNAEDFIRPSEIHLRLMEKQIKKTNKRKG